MEEFRAFQDRGAERVRNDAMQDDVVYSVWDGQSYCKSCSSGSKPLVSGFRVVVVP